MINVNYLLENWLLIIQLIFICALYLYQIHKNELLKQFLFTEKRVSVCKRIDLISKASFDIAVLFFIFSGGKYDAAQYHK